MRRAILACLAGLLLAGCSGGDLRDVAENIRVRAEVVGAQAEARRSDALLASAGDGGYGTVQVPAKEAEAPAEAEKAAPKAAPQQPVYVVVPAY